MTLVRRLPWFIVTALLLAPHVAWADSGLSMGARSVARGYQIRASDGQAVPRRTIAQSVALRAWAGPGPAEPVFTGVFDLRLRTDLGLESSLTSRLYDDSEAFIAPDVRLAYVRGHAIGELLDLTLGRHLYVGPDATERIDGGEVRLASPTGFGLAVRAGALVTPASALSRDPAFGGFFADRESPRAGRTPAVVGASVGFASRDLDVTLAARRLTEGPDPARGGDVLDERAALAVRGNPTPASQLQALGVWDVPRERVARADLDLSADLTERLSGEVGAGIWRPDFWLGSVWDVFGARQYAAFRTGVRYGWEPGLGEVELGATGEARSYGDAESEGVPLFDDDANGASFGARADAHWRWARRPARYLTDIHGDLWVRAEDGVGGLILFGGAGAGADIVSHRLAAGVRAFGMRTEPELQPFQAGTSGALALDLTSRLGPFGRIQLSLEGLSNAPFLTEVRGFLAYQVGGDVVGPRLPVSRFLVRGAAP